MSIYDEARDYLNSDVQPSCDYNIYLALWDFVDKMESQFDAKYVDMHGYATSDYADTPSHMFTHIQLMGCSAGENVFGELLWSIKRKELVDSCEEGRRLSEKIEGENAKLRELVADMWPSVQFECYCTCVDKEGRNPATCEDGRPCKFRNIHGHIRELEVEVRS